MGGKAFNLKIPGLFVHPSDGMVRTQCKQVKDCYLMGSEPGPPWGWVMSALTYILQLHSSINLSSFCDLIVIKI